jgi:hypothetical protein
VIEALARLEAAGVIRRVRRLVLAAVLICGIERLTTVQGSNLYGFGEPSPTAHILPVRSRPGKVERLLAAIVKGFEPSPAGDQKPATLENKRLSVIT